MMHNQPPPLMGTLLSIPSPTIAEIASLSGFDWIMIDMEHSAITIPDVQLMTVAAQPRSKVIVRPPGHDRTTIGRILDIGCDGIMVPMVNNVHIAKAVIAAAQYPPQGNRGMTIGRAHGYGHHTASYLHQANAEVDIILQIEHMDGVANLDGILQIQGFTAILIGPNDLAGSMGLPGQIDHPKVQQAISHIIQKCQQAGVPFGIFGSNASFLMPYLGQGCRYPLLGLDSLVITKAFQELLLPLKNET